MTRSASAGRRFLAICVLSLPPLLVATACGRAEPFAPQSVETQRVWQGVGIWDVPEDTAPMSAIQGRVMAAPNLVYIANGLRWTVRTVEEIDRGIARTWPGTDNRWVAVRIDLDLASPPPPDSATVIRPVPRSVILREQVVLLDRAGNRHLPILVHDRIIPPIDRPITIDTPGFQAVLLFAIRREENPTALEIHDPLGDTRLAWATEVSPADWIPIRRKVILVDESRRALWEAELRRVRSGAGEFLAELSLRNVGAVAKPLPDAAAARLYTGGGRTIRSASSGIVRTLEPGRSHILTLRFADVPRRESLELVLPAEGRLIRIDALPGFAPEEVIPLHRPVVTDGIRINLYGVRRDSELQLRLGLLNLTEIPAPLAGILIEALRVTGAQPASLDAPPDILWPDFEERRWTSPIPADVQALRITIPGRRAIVITI